MKKAATEPEEYSMSVSELARKECVPCKGGTPPVKGEELRKLQDELNSGWKVVDEHHLEKEYKFDSWEQAVDFTNRVAQIASEQDHHPDIHLSYGKVKIVLWTHKAGGLTPNDFIVAAKAEEAAR
jgi:4a-hydroxytetrahydrobiopterin dehydratase